MRIFSENVARTRKNLLAAGGAIFKGKGYRDRNIAEISSRAGTNIAAVNYHFGLDGRVETDAPHGRDV